MEHHLLKCVTKKLSSCGLSGKDLEEESGMSIKSFLLDKMSEKEVEVVGAGAICIEVKSDDFSECLFSDYKRDLGRIDSQVENVDKLIAASAQVAWVLVTAYYAAFFMANSISKLSGEFITNLSREELEELLAYASGLGNFKVESNNVLKVSYSPAKYEGRVQVRLIKHQSKPHQEAWRCLGGIINDLDIEDIKVHDHRLLLNVCYGNGWVNPSAIRNRWNYSDAKYFSIKGDDIGCKFYKLISSRSSSYGWARDRRLSPHEKNVAASLAYVYHFLLAASTAIRERLNV